MTTPAPALTSSRSASGRGGAFWGRSSMKECTRAFMDKLPATVGRKYRVIFQRSSWTVSWSSNHVHGLLMLLGNANASNQPETFGRPKSRSVSTVIRSYKAAVSKRINELCGSTGSTWQAGFHEHIIRNTKELEATRRYIELNPLKWALDRENLSATEVDPIEPWETVVQETQFGGSEVHSRS